MGERMGFFSKFGEGLGKGSGWVRDGSQYVWGGIKDFFGSTFGEIGKGFSEGMGWEEAKRKEEERKKGMTRGLVGEEMDKAVRDEWERMSSKSSSSSSFPRRMSSSMLLTGVYRR